MKKLIAAAVVAFSVLVAAPAAAAPEAAPSGGRELVWGFKPRPVLQNKVWWFGPDNPNSPARVVFSEVFRPRLQQRGVLKNLNLELCLLGRTVVFGPYGTVTRSVSKGCN